MLLSIEVSGLAEKRVRAGAVVQFYLSRSYYLWFLGHPGRGEGGRG